MRRLFVLGMLLWAPQVWAQCQPTNSPTLTQSKQVLKVDDYAAQSNKPVTATINGQVTNVTGGVASHVLTITPGTQILVTRSSNNAVSATLAAYTDGALSWTENVGVNSTDSWTFYQSEVGHTYKYVFSDKDSYGNNTQDVLTVNVAAGSQPSIISQDESPTNVYILVSGIYSGTPDIPYTTTCTQAAEKPMAPTAQLQVFNLSSGESRPGVTFNGATTVVGQPVYATAYDYVSALPGDTITGTFQGITFCTAIGNIFSHLQWFRIEEATTIVKDLGHPPRVGPDGGSEYDVAPICQNNCDPPDWPVNVVDSFTGRHQYWIAATSCLRAPDVDGAPWFCAADYMYDIENTIGELTVAEILVRGIAVPYLGPSSVFPVPGKCTKYPVNVIATVGPGDIKRFFGFGNN